MSKPKPTARRIAKPAKQKAPTIESMLHARLALIARGECPQDIAAGFIAVVERAALAAVVQSKADAAGRRVCAAREIGDPMDKVTLATNKHFATQRETHAAGAALLASIKGLTS